MRRFVLLVFACFALIVAPVFAQSEPPEELFVTILVNGLVDESWHYQTLFRFVELSGTTASPAVVVQIDPYDNSGKPINHDSLFCPPAIPTLDPLQLSLPGLGSVHLGTKGFIQPYEPKPGVFDGWARVTVTGPGKILGTAEILQVSGVPVGCPPVICLRPSGIYNSDAVVYLVKAAKAFRAPAVISPYRHTAFSVVNPSKTETAHVCLQLYQTEGTLLAQSEITSIPPLQRRSFFAREWTALDAPQNSPFKDSFYGSARIFSDVPIAVGALQILLPEGKLVTAVVTPEL